MDLGTPGQRIKLQGVRRSIADHMVASKKTIPHYSYIDECDVSELVALRNELKRPFYASGIKLTNLPFYVKAVVTALKQVPIINASLDDQAGEIVLHDQYHIGIATATSKGLVVPVLRHADRKDLAEIATRNRTTYSRVARRDDLTLRATRKYFHDFVGRQYWRARFDTDHSSSGSRYRGHWQSLQTSRLHG